MTIFHSQAPPLPPIPDDKTTVQFIFDQPLPKQPDTPEIPEPPCHVDEITGRKVYLDELRRRVGALAASLQKDYGIGDGDVVCIFSQNHIDYPAFLWAAHRLGAIVAPVNSALTPGELVYHLQITQPSLMLVHANGLKVAEQALEQFPALSKSRIIVLDKPKELIEFKSLDEVVENGAGTMYREYILKSGEGKTKVAFLCFSSGTTGKPKAVAISHYNVICNMMQIATHSRAFEAYTAWDNRRFRPGDVVLGVLPMFHVYGLVCTIHVFIYAGMTLVVSPTFDFARFLKSISQYRITHLMIVPPQAVLLVKHPLSKKADLSSIRFVVLAAAPTTVELIEQLQQVLPKTVELGQGYGLTELCAGCSMYPTGSKIGTPGSAGRLVPGTIAKIVKPDGQLAKAGEAGDLYVKGGQVALGYWKNEQATKEVFLPDGWLRTGDQVIIQPNGDLFVVDRIKEIIKVKGFQVAPAELEGHLLDHPLIADAGVVGVADPYSGEVPLAFVVLQPSAAKALKEKSQVERIRKEIYKFVSSAKMRMKWLDGGIVFVEAIPKSPSGKILRRVMRDNVKAMPVSDLESVRVKVKELEMAKL